MDGERGEQGELQHRPSQVIDELKVGAAARLGRANKMQEQGCPAPSLQATSHTQHVPQKFTNISTSTCSQLSLQLFTLSIIRLHESHSTILSQVTR